MTHPPRHPCAPPEVEASPPGVEAPPPKAETPPGEVGALPAPVATASTEVAPSARAEPPLAESRVSIEQLVSDLHAGHLDPATLSVAERRRCVGYLTDQAFTTAEITQLLGMNERTIRRDRTVIRREAGVSPDNALGDELLGEFERIVTGSVSRLTRLARDPANPAYARMWAEEAMVRIYHRYIETARRMHYFDDGARRLRTQRQSDPAELERLKISFDETRKLMRTMG